MVEDEQGVPLSMGRKRRVISGALKQALLRRDGACTFPGCTHRVFLEGHHVQHWADGGETSLKNTALLCTLHHRYVHEHGYEVEMGAEQRLQFRDPHGRVVAQVPASAAGRVTELGWPRLHRAHEGLGITSETNTPQWDGSRMPYGTVVGQLLWIDEDRQGNSIDNS